MNEHSAPTRVQGASILLRSFFSEKAGYEWKEYGELFLVPNSRGMLVQGVWDRWPECGPAQRQVACMIEAAPPKAGARCLDVGCGSGGFANEFLATCPDVAEYVALDRYTPAIEKARTLLRHDSRVKFFVRDALALSHEFDTEFLTALTPKFDRIYLSEVTQDLLAEEVVRLLDFCFGVLRPRGSVVMFALSLNAPPRTLGERLTFDMIVRPGSPTLDQIRRALQRPNVTIQERDWTPWSTGFGLKRLREDKSITNAILPWPLSKLLQFFLHAGDQVVNRGDFTVTMFVATKNES